MESEKLWECRRKGMERQSRALQKSSVVFVDGESENPACTAGPLREATAAPHRPGRLDPESP
jgi:hypothetical protein